VECVTGVCQSRFLTLKRDIVDLQNYADVPLVRRCFADVVHCLQPVSTVGFTSLR